MEGRWEEVKNEHNKEEKTAVFTSPEKGTNKQELISHHAPYSHALSYNTNYVLFLSLSVTSHAHACPIFIMRILPNSWNSLKTFRLLPDFSCDLTYESLPPYSDLSAFFQSCVPLSKNFNSPSLKKNKLANAFSSCNTFVFANYIVIKSIRARVNRSIYSPNDFFRVVCDTVCRKYDGFSTAGVLK